MSSFIEKLWELGPALVDGTPHARELGMKFVAIDTGIATLSCLLYTSPSPRDS